MNDCIGLNGGAFVLNEKNKHNNEASMDTKNTYNDIPNHEEIPTEPTTEKADKGGAPTPSAGISLASMQTKLEALPEIEQLTAELLDEAKNPPSPERGKKAKKTEQGKSGKSCSKLKPAQKTAQAAEPLTTDKTTPKAEAVQSAETTPKDESIQKPSDSATEPAAAPERENEAQTHEKSNPRHGRTKRIIVTALLSVFGIILLLVGIEAVRLLNIFHSVNYVKGANFFADTEMVVSQSAIAKYVSHSDETKNILLVGYDVDKYGVSRSDSMIILTLDHEHQKIKMTSLMRDMYVYIPDHGRHKLNAAFVYGGPELLLETIYANFGLQIDNYVCVDYAAFVDAVDYIGGVEVEIEEIELEQFNKYVGGGQKNKIDQAGTYIFNGQQTLSYCRIRKVGTDTARTARQREVLEKIMKRCSRMSLLKLENLLRITAPAVTTNLTQAQIFQLAAEGLDSMNYDMQGMRIPVDGTWWDALISDTWYVQIDLNANAAYLHDFIYSDDEIADELAANLAESDSAAEEHEKEVFERKKAKENGE